MNTDAAKANKPRECRTCNRRRIFCDGTLPTCLKCAKKGLECPGYKSQLRWADGVAVRGRLRGQRLPVTAGESSKAGDAVSKSRPTSGIITPPAVTNKAKPATPKPGTPGYVAPSPSEGSRSEEFEYDFNGMPIGEPSQFLRYYDKNLAGLMVWVDSEQNLYRTKVLPRAMNTLGLRYAIMAISSQHGGPVFHNEGENFHETARDACLSMVQERLKEMTGRLGSGIELGTEKDIDDAEWMLASILMLACYEMARSRMSIAEGHRLAARRLVHIFQSHPAACKSKTFGFLRSQLAIYDVLVSTTSFDMDDIDNTILPPEGEHDSMFSSYLRLVHKVSATSRRRTVNPAALRLEDMMTPSQIRQEFNQTRGATLMAAGKLDALSEGTRRDFIRLVDIYHYTAILYSYRCLGFLETEAADRVAALTKLMEEMDALEDTNVCIQNLPWPVFVAGTECHGDLATQARVRVLMQSIIRATNFQHYNTAVDFLDAFWAGPNPDWRPLAEQWQNSGVRVLLV